MSRSLAEYQAIAPKKLDMYERAILVQIWNPGNHFLKQLGYKATFLTTAEVFDKHVVPEEYPSTYSDSFHHGGRRYFISYIMTSSLYLHDLAADKPKTPIAFQLRVISDSGFYCCLVRKWDTKWTKDWLVGSCGAMEFRPPGKAEG